MKQRIMFLIYAVLKGGKILLVHVLSLPDNASAPVVVALRKEQARKRLDRLIRCAAADGLPAKRGLLGGIHQP